MRELVPQKFICRACGFIKIYEDGHCKIPCPECGRKNFIIRGTKDRDIPVENPRYSVSLGVSETQIEEARRLHPEAEWKKFGHSYRPLIKNRADKVRMMRQAKFEEFDTHQFQGREGLYKR